MLLLAIVAKHAIKLVAALHGRLGLTYEFEQTNDGKVLTPNLTVEDLDEVWGSAELGMRGWTDNGSIWEVSIGHGGIGVSDLEAWRARLSANFVF